MIRITRCKECLLEGPFLQGRRWSYRRKNGVIVLKSLLMFYDNSTSVNL